MQVQIQVLILTISILKYMDNNSKIQLNNRYILDYYIDLPKTFPRKMLFTKLKWMSEISGRVYVETG